jgi:hypothetical protein
MHPDHLPEDRDDATDAPQKTVYWWSAEQLERAGWHCTAINTFDLQLYVWHRDGQYSTRHCGGAWLPEPPPPEELSDDEIEARIQQLRCGGERQSDLAWAADVAAAVRELERCVAKNDPMISRQVHHVILTLRGRR